MTPSDALFEKYVSTLDSLLSAKEGTIALLDFPYHWNAGDSAIWLGERRALEGRTFRYLADRKSFSTRPARRSDFVLLHGGGSVGSRWPEMAAHRLEVLTGLRGSNVIQLPQSADVEAEPHLRSLARLSRSLESFSFFARDLETADMASACGLEDVRICPDPGFGIDVPEHIWRIEPSVDVLLLLRNDHESRISDGTLERAKMSGLLVRDWLRPSQRFERDWFQKLPGNRLRRASVTVAYGGRINVEVRGRIFDHIAKRNVLQALELLASAKVVITDRLHGHILCERLGKPNICLDTVDRKIGRFREAFTASSRFAVNASSIPEAIALSTRLCA